MEEDARSFAPGFSFSVFSISAFTPCPPSTSKAPSSREHVSDVWSFAASLYQLLSGKFPYRFDPKRDPIDIILNENPVPIRDRMAGLEKNLAAVIDKALVRNLKDRSPDAGKLLAAIPKPRP